MVGVWVGARVGNKLGGLDEALTRATIEGTWYTTFLWKFAL